MNFGFCLITLHAVFSVSNVFIERESKVIPVSVIGLLVPGIKQRTCSFLPQSFYMVL